jgi:small subunit ribosomal protein S2
MTANLSLMKLYESGASRGNSKSKLNPKLKNRIWGFESTLAVIDLTKTIANIEKASSLLTSLGQKKRQVLIVGVSKHLKSKIERYASLFKDSQMPYVNHRWLGGTLSNWPTVKKTLKTLEKIESMVANQEFYEALARKEQLSLIQKKEKISKFFNGLKSMKSNRPGAIIVIDASQNPIAIQEAEAIKIPVICLTNTNVLTLPENLNYTIVCNVNSLNTVDLVMDELAQGYNKGFQVALEQKEEAQKNNPTGNNQNYNNRNRSNDFRPRQNNYNNNSQNNYRSQNR